MQLAALASTLWTIGFKLVIFEFRLACYQWGNSWCLYSFCLIGFRLGHVKLIVIIIMIIIIVIIIAVIMMAVV